MEFRFNEANMSILLLVREPLEFISGFDIDSFKPANRGLTLLL